ncbi:MAG: ribonuclease HI [Cyclobacteriaceae bacterium]|jgi:ribonuclease HI
MIKIYTDGAALGNPGPGGYGIIMEYGAHRKELSCGFRLTTNNRMELLAVIDGLRAIRKSGIPVTVYSDSKYVVESVEKGWLWNWVRKNFKDKKNEDLWRQYIPLHHQYKPRFVWIKGHNDHPQNERCDALAVAAANGFDLQVDEVYERLKD